jgi:hypothetical protein
VSWRGALRVRLFLFCIRKEERLFIWPLAGLPMLSRADTDASSVPGVVRAGFCDASEAAFCSRVFSAGLCESAPSALNWALCENGRRKHLAAKMCEDEASVYDETGDEAKSRRANDLLMAVYGMEYGISKVVLSKASSWKCSAKPAFSEALVEPV